MDVGHTHAPLCDKQDPMSVIEHALSEHHQDLWTELELYGLSTDTDGGASLFTSFGVTIAEADHVRPSTAYIFHVAFLVVRRGVRRSNRNAKRREERRAETVRDGSSWSFVAKVCLPVS